MKRSLGLAGMGVLAGCGIPSAPAAQRARPHRIGYLVAGTLTSVAPNLDAFRQGLREHRYVEGQDLTIGVRTADGRGERLPELAADLVRWDPDVLLAGGAEAIRAAMQATRTIPIVFAAVGDPVAEGFVDSLARPGGNATGLRNRAGEECAKQVQLLTQSVPGMSRVAVLAKQGAVRELRETEVAGQRLGVDILALELQSPDDLDTVMAAAITGRADGLLVITDALFTPLAPQIVAFAARHRLPAITGSRTYTTAGGLLTYGGSIRENYHRAAAYVDKIFKGARPADLPVEQPTRFDFVINLKTEQELGLTIPQSVLHQATEVIQ